MKRNEACFALRHSATVGPSAQYHHHYPRTRWQLRAGDHSRAAGDRVGEWLGRPTRLRTTLHTAASCRTTGSLCRPPLSGRCPSPLPPHGANPLARLPPVYHACRYLWPQRVRPGRPPLWAASSSHRCRSWRRRHLAVAGVLHSYHGGSGGGGDRDGGRAPSSCPLPSPAALYRRSRSRHGGRGGDQALPLPTRQPQGACADGASGTGGRVLGGWGGDRSEGGGGGWRGGDCFVGIRWDGGGGGSGCRCG